MSTATNKNGTFEREVHALSGWIMLVVNIALVIGAVVFVFMTIGAGARHEIPAPSVALRVIGAIVWLIAAIVSFSGHFTLQPNEARVLILFGYYKGTVRRSGFYWANPFYSRSPRQDFEDGERPSRSEGADEHGHWPTGRDPATSPRRSRCAHTTSTARS